jgi:hypothetical protein
MIVSEENLIMGMSRWHSQRSNWPDDFHNRTYFELRDANMNFEFSDEWLDSAIEPPYSTLASLPPNENLRNR